MNAPQGVNLMWNTPLLLPGVLLTPVTLSVRAAGEPDRAADRHRSRVGHGRVRRPAALAFVPAAALAAAVYGLWLVRSAIGPYDLQFAVFPPLIAEKQRSDCSSGRASHLRDGLILWLLVAAQLFISEEIAFDAALAAAALVIVVAAR